MKKVVVLSFLRIIQLNSLPDDKFCDKMDTSLCPTENLPTKCNTTIYKLWKKMAYPSSSRDGLNLHTDPNFWIYQTQSQVILTNELALESSYTTCLQQFRNLITFKGGRHGPLDVQHTYDVMCSKYCRESDVLHHQAMCCTGCTCLELSTQLNDTAYHIEGDYCRKNTGRLLCHLLGYCGVWNCHLEDFACPRYEYNIKYIDWRGHGSCSPANKILPSLEIIAMVTFVFITYLMIG